MSAAVTYLQRKPSLWKSTFAIGRLLFFCVAMTMFVISCIRETFGYAIFWGVMLVLEEIRGVAKTIEEQSEKSSGGLR